jgi:hypothetical protein
LHTCTHHVSNLLQLGEQVCTHTHAAGQGVCFTSVQRAGMCLHTCSTRHVCVSLSSAWSTGICLGTCCCTRGIQVCFCSMSRNALAHMQQNTHSVFAHLQLLSSECGHVPVLLHIQQVTSMSALLLLEKRGLIGHVLVHMQQHTPCVCLSSSSTRPAGMCRRTGSRTRVCLLCFRSKSEHAAALTRIQQHTRRVFACLPLGPWL